MLEGRFKISKYNQVRWSTKKLRRNDFDTFLLRSINNSPSFFLILLQKMRNSVESKQKNLFCSYKWARWWKYNFLHKNKCKCLLLRPILAFNGREEEFFVKIIKILLMEKLLRILLSWKTILPFSNAEIKFSRDFFYWILLW